MKSTTGIEEQPPKTNGLACRQNNGGMSWFNTFHSCVIVLTSSEYDKIALTSQSHLSNTCKQAAPVFITPGESSFPHTLP